MICGFRLQSSEILLDAPHNSHDPTILKFKSHQVETGIFRSHLIWGYLSSVKDFTTVGFYPFNPVLQVQGERSR